MTDVGIPTPIRCVCGVEHVLGEMFVRTFRRYTLTIDEAEEGQIGSVLVLLRHGRVARRETIDDSTVCLDAAGETLAIELSGPTKVRRLLLREHPSHRDHFETFLRAALPASFVEP